MISQQEFQGHWNQLKGQVKEKWGQLTDNDLTSVEGNLEKLVGLIQQKTGTARREVENFFDNCVSQSTATANRLAQTAQEYMHGASESVAAGYEDLSNRIQRGYE